MAQVEGDLLEAVSIQADLVFDHDVVSRARCTLQALVGLQEQLVVAVAGDAAVNNSAGLGVPAAFAFLGVVICIFLLGSIESGVVPLADNNHRHLGPVLFRTVQLRESSLEVWKLLPQHQGVLAFRHAIAVEEDLGGQLLVELAPALETLHNHLLQDRIGDTVAKFCLLLIDHLLLSSLFADAARPLGETTVSAGDSRRNAWCALCTARRWVSDIDAHHHCLLVKRGEQSVGNFLVDSSSLEVELEGEVPHVHALAELLGELASDRADGVDSKLNVSVVLDSGVQPFVVVGQNDEDQRTFVVRSALEETLQDFVVVLSIEHRERLKIFLEGGVMRAHRQAVVLQLPCKLLDEGVVSLEIRVHGRASGDVEDTGDPPCKVSTFSKGLTGTVPGAVEWRDFLPAVKDVRRGENPTLNRQHARAGFQAKRLHGSALYVGRTLKVKQPEACARRVRISCNRHGVLVRDACSELQHPGGLVATEELAVRLAWKDGAELGRDVDWVVRRTDVEDWQVRLLDDIALLFEVVEDGLFAIRDKGSFGVVFERERHFVGVTETLDHNLGLSTVRGHWLGKAEDSLHGFDGLLARSLVLHLQLANEHLPLLGVPASKALGKIEQRY